MKSYFCLFLAYQEQKELSSKISLFSINTLTVWRMHYLRKTMYEVVLTWFNLVYKFMSAQKCIWYTKRSENWMSEETSSARFMQTFVYLSIELNSKREWHPIGDHPVEISTFEWWNKWNCFFFFYQFNDTFKVDLDQDLETNTI